MIRLFNRGALLGLLAVGSVCHGAEAPGPTDLTELPLESLLQMEVSLVSRTPEKLSSSPAAIAVVTQEDIRRSGSTSIEEALRLVPGLQVARVDAGQWAITARGFNDVFANKLLLLQDGRTLYTPLFSGVFWDVQGTMMEDIERIEVVRGPGAALWGANAVNGVINIITKSARETQGLLLAAGGGTEERAFASVRYGARISEHAYFRVYGTYQNHDASLLADGERADDSWQLGRWGFRVDWELSEQNHLSLQGEAYRGAINQVYSVFDASDPVTLSRMVPDEYEVVGGHLLGRWIHAFGADSELRVQAYYDRAERDIVIFREKRDTFDVEFQHQSALGSRQDVVWGAGFRFTGDDIGNSSTISLNPSSRTLNLFSSFVQDQITVVPERLEATLGTKLERNDFSGWEVQPGARLSWTPSAEHTLWGSISRAVRTPSRAEDDIILNQVIAPGGLFPGSPAALTTIYGNRRFKSEELLAYEIGYRFQPQANLSIDLAAFYNDYDRLRTLEPGASPTQPVVPGPGLPLHVENELFGEAYGVELAATWEITRWWRLQPAYSFLDLELHRRPGSQDTISEHDEGKSPRHQVSVRSSVDLPYEFAIACVVRYVDRLPALNISSYVGLDVRLSWRPTRHLEFSIIGQDLLDNRHTEFRPSFIDTQQTDVQRGVYGKVLWRF
jgi:iron complex outermembrane receptor protein